MDPIDVLRQPAVAIDLASRDVAERTEWRAGESLAGGD
jgi:hypothetical protein